MEYLRGWNDSVTALCAQTSINGALLQTDPIVAELQRLQTDEDSLSVCVCV